MDRFSPSIAGREAVAVCHSFSVVDFVLPSNVSPAFSTVNMANAVFSRCFLLKPVLVKQNGHIR